MKKTIIAVAALLFITGCGEKKVSCTYDLYGQGSGETVATFTKDGKLKTASEKTTLNTDGYSEGDVNEALDESKKACDEAKKKYKGINCTVKKNKDGIVMEVKYDFDKMDDETIKNYGLEEFKSISYDEYVEEMKNENQFTCKY